MTLFVLSDDAFIYKLGLAILVSLEKKLAGDDMDEVAVTLNNIAEHINYDKVIRSSQKMRISVNDINKIRSA